MLENSEFRERWGAKEKGEKRKRVKEGRERGKKGGENGKER